MVTKADEKWDAIGDNPLVIISEIRKLMSDWTDEAAENIQDEDVNYVLDMVIRMIGDDIPDPAKIGRVMVRLEAYNIKFRDRFSSYMGFKKGTTDANAKKNYYKELYTGVDRLVDALKYMVR